VYVSNRTICVEDTPFADSKLNRFFSSNCHKMLMDGLKNREILNENMEGFL